MIRIILPGTVFLTSVLTALAVGGLTPEAARPEGPASSGILEDNLATTWQEIYNFEKASKWDNSWVAIDYTPATAVTVTAFRHHYLYNATPLKNRLNFQLFRGDNPGVGSLVATWSVPAAGWTEYDTGWIMFGRKVYLCVVPFTPGRNLAANRHYWFAYQSENNQPANIVYWAFRPSIKGDRMWIKYSGSDPWQRLPYTCDGSYRLDGGYTAVAPASIGKIKTLYR